MELEKTYAIFNEDYAPLRPFASMYRALTVMNFKDARLAFNYCGYLDFLICLNEETKTFGICHSVMECDEFYNPPKTEQL